jgi:hypothetical protein
MSQWKVCRTACTKWYGCCQTWQQKELLHRWYAVTYSNDKHIQMGNSSATIWRKERKHTLFTKLKLTYHTHKHKFKDQYITFTSLLCSKTTHYIKRNLHSYPAVFAQPILRCGIMCVVCSIWSTVTSKYHFWYIADPSTRPTKMFGLTLETEDIQLCTFLFFT